MHYGRRAIVGKIDALAPVTAATGEQPVPLRQGLGLVPVRRAAFDRMGDGAGGRDAVFWFLSVGIERVLLEASTASPLAYLEADIFGGVGWQAAGVWLGGGVVLGPVCTDVEPSCSTTLSKAGAFNVALRFIGARSGGHVDEFEAVGLNAHRHTDDWVVATDR